ncbi:unnamed protein product, partial [Cyprideis torosa]
MITQDQAKDLGARLETLVTHLHLEDKRIQILNEEEKTAAPGFWDDPKKAEVTLKKLRQLKYWVEGFETAQAQFNELELSLEFFKEGGVSEAEVVAAHKKVETTIEELEFKNMLSGEEDKLSAVLQITAGAGGTESCDWAQMLMRMYVMWAEKSGMTVTELNLQQGDVAGIKTVTIQIDGDYGFGYLKGENGVHRLNKEKAVQLLKSQLYEMEIEARNAARAEIEAGKKKIEWGSQIRNYVMHPYKLVKDVRTAHETSNVDGVMN